MDAYLESLVVKDDLCIDNTEINEVDEPVNASSEESVSEQELLATVDKVDKLADAAEPEKSDHANLKEEPKMTVPNKYEVDKVYFVKDVKTYRSPDVRQIAKIVTGNIIYKGKIEEFHIIEYMKHGFGTVRAYALNLD